MEKMPEIKHGVETINSHTYNENEMSAESLQNLEHAEENSLIQVSRFGTKIKVDFLDISDSPLLPSQLYHIRHPRDIQLVEGGVKGSFYVQDGSLSVEPENISLYQSDKKPAIFVFDINSSGNSVVTLDPECFGGIPDEYMRAFIVYPNEPIFLQKLDMSVDEIRSNFASDKNY